MIGQSIGSTNQPARAYQFIHCSRFLMTSTSVFFWIGLYILFIVTKAKERGDLVSLVIVVWIVLFAKQFLLCNTFIIYFTFQWALWISKFQPHSSSSSSSVSIRPISLFQTRGHVFILILLENDLKLISTFPLRVLYFCSICRFQMNHSSINIDGLFTMLEGWDHSISVEHARICLIH